MSECVLYYDCEHMYNLLVDPVWIRIVKENKIVAMAVQ